MEVYTYVIGQDGVYDAGSREQDASIKDLIASHEVDVGIQRPRHSFPIPSLPVNIDFDRICKPSPQKKARYHLHIPSNTNTAHSTIFINNAYNLTEKVIP